jgi:hypothetical protein
MKNADGMAVVNYTNQVQTHSLAAGARLQEYSFQVIHKDAVLIMPLSLRNVAS